MRVYKDGNDGITEKSKEFVQKLINNGVLAKDNIAKIVLDAIKMQLEGYHVDIFTKTGDKIMISGWSWNYGGEGPHGLLWFFKEMDIPFTIGDIAKWKWTDVHEIKKIEDIWTHEVTFKGVGGAR